MQRKNSPANVVYNLALLIMIILMILLPLLKVEQYSSAMEPFSSYNDFIDMDLLLNIGIIVSGIIALIINFNLLIVFYKLADVEISNKEILAIYAISNIILNLLFMFFNFNSLTINFILIKDSIALLIYMLIAVLYFKLIKKIFKYKIILPILYFNLILLFFDLFVNMWREL